MSNTDDQALEFIEAAEKAAEKAIGILLKGPPLDQVKKLLNNQEMNTVGLRLQSGINSE